MPESASQLFAALLGGAVGAFILAFFYFAVNDRTALRSESFTIRSRLIDAGYYGDKKGGLVSAPLLDVNATEAEDISEDEHSDLDVTKERQ